MPKVLLLPVLFVFANVLVFVFGLGVGGYILSIPELDASSMIANITTTANISYTNQWASMPSAAVMEAAAQVAGEASSLNQTSGWSIPGGYTRDVFNAEEVNGLTWEVKMVLLLIHLFGVIWTMQIIEGVWICTISGAVSDYYWIRDDKSKSEGCCDCCAPCLRLPCCNCECPPPATGLCCTEGSVERSLTSVPLALLNIW